MVIGALTVANHLFESPLELLAGSANLFIASCYFIIGTLIARGLWRNRKEGVDVLVSFTAAIFLSCALGHTAHGIGMLGLSDTLIWQACFDLLTVIPAVGFLSYHSSYGLLVRFSNILKSKAELEQRNGELERSNEVLTELQRMQQQLIQMEKMSLLGQMVSGISHEINNPINFIYGNLPYVEEHVQDLLKVVEAYQSSYSKEPAKVQEVLEEVDIDFVLEDLPRIVDSMKLGSARISELVLNLRNFYRLDEREMKASDLHEGIESTLVLLHNRYKRKIEIVKQFGDIQLVECHINQLNQVFMNLLANAIDALLADEYSTAQTQHDAASLHQKQITITTQQIDAERVAVRITDNGAGIPVEVQNRVFEPLFTTKPRGIGTGLGLSIAHQIVTEKHHGQIYCCSTPGEGTTFVVEVPICQPRESRIEVDTESRILTASV